MESFYNRNAEDYFQKTWKLDLKEIYGKFLRYVPSGGKILDVGCGSGRDAYHFSQAGYVVTALDESIELINKVRNHVDCQVQHGSFYDFNEKNIYDGIWCCASLLHCAENKLEDVLHSLILGLKPLGILYMSYKVSEGKIILVRTKLVIITTKMGAKAMVRLGPEVVNVPSLLWIST